jgi:hypothetical protein
VSFRKLSKHIRDKHYRFVKEYYDKHIKTEADGKCQICGNNTNFLNLSSGYRDTCGYRCSCILKRRILKQTPEKYASFCEKMKVKMSNFWKELNNDEEKLKEWHKKQSENYQIFLNSLTQEERIEQFGYLNSLSENKRKKIITKMVSYLTNFYNTATEEEIQEVYKKRIDTKVKRGICSPYEDRGAYDVYETKVRSMSLTSYKKYINIINPNGYRRGNVGYHIDHKISILYGFLNNIPMDVISHPANLCMKTHTENLRKHHHCDITIDELYENIRKFNEEKISPT